MRSIKTPSAHSGHSKACHSDTDVKTLKGVNVDLCKELSKLQLENESYKDDKSEIKMLREKCTHFIAIPPKSLAAEIMPSLKCLSGSINREQN